MKRTLEIDSTHGDLSNGGAKDRGRGLQVRTDMKAGGLLDWIFERQRANENALPTATGGTRG